MTRSKKIILGVATAWPPVFTVSFSVYLSLLLATMGDDRRVLRDLLDAFPVWFGLVLLTASVHWGVFVVYVRLIRNDDMLALEERNRWSRLMIYTGGVAAWWYFRRRVVLRRDGEG